MNARLYDPVHGRFLAPDPYVQAPDMTQNFNRYTYALNNPLAYSDPNGEFLVSFLAAWVGTKIAAVITGAIIGAAVGAASYTVSVALSDGGFKNWNAGQFWKSVGMGALSGAVTAGIGNMGISNVFAKAFLHGSAQGFMSELGGGDFLQGFASGALGSLGAAGFRGVAGSLAGSAAGQIGFGALSGGIGAWATGGEFWKGAVTGGIVAGLNDVLHQTLGGEPKFFKKLKKHYESKSGDNIELSEEEFRFLVSKGKIDYKNAKLINSKNNIYQASIDFYSSGFDLANTFGKATVTYRVVNGKNLFRTFYDKYDFDPKPWGTRSRWSEIKTRVYNIYSSGKAFEIKFNQNYLR